MPLQGRKTVETANPCRYTEDNKIYQADREFTFEFHYFDPQGKER